MWSMRSVLISKVAAALILSATQAAALTCVPMGPGDVYQIIAREEAAEYVVLEGRLSFDPTSLPQSGAGAPKTPQRFSAHFAGLMLGERFFDQDVTGELLIESHCEAGQCGALQDGERYLLFARQEADALVLPLDPCVSFAFSAADGAAGDVILQCHKGLECPSELPVPPVSFD